MCKQFDRYRNRRETYEKIFKNLGTPHLFVPFSGNFGKNLFFRHSQAENVVLFANEIVSEIETRISNQFELKAPIIHPGSNSSL